MPSDKPIRVDFGKVPLTLSVRELGQIIGKLGDEIARLTANRDRWHRRTMLARLEVAVLKSGPTPDELLATIEGASRRLDEVADVLDRTLATQGVQVPDDPGVYCDPPEEQPK